MQLRRGREPAATGPRHRGFLELENAFAYRGLRLTVGKAGRREELKLLEVNRFASEMDHLSMCVVQDKAPLTPGEEGLADIRVIAAIEEAARSGRAVKVGGA